MLNSRDTMANGRGSSRTRHSSTSSGGGSNASRFPLATDHFPPVEVNEAQSEFLQQESDELVDDMVKNVRWEMHFEDSSRGWKLSSSKKHFRDMGVRTYCRKPDSLTERKSRRMDFKCIGKVAMSLDQVMSAFRGDTTADYRHNASVLLDSCLDAAVLHVVKGASQNDPHRYLGINWIALRSPGLFGKKRDFCFLRSTGTTFDSQMNELGYLVTRSIDVRECHSLEESHGTVRTKMSAVMLLKESPDLRSTSVMWQATLPMASFSSSKILEFVHSNFMSYIANLNVYAVTKFMTQEVHVDQFVTPRRERKNCHLCKKRFSMMRTRHHCHSCGEMMCRGCEISRRVTELERNTAVRHGTTFDSGKVRRYCKQCVSSAQRKLADRAPLSKLMSFDVTKSGTSVQSAPNSPHVIDQSERFSALSSTGSQCSLQLTWPDTIQPPKRNTIHTVPRHSVSNSVTTPTYGMPLTSANLSSSRIPESPLSIKTQGMQNHRSRLETDPWEHYDTFDPPPALPTRAEMDIAERDSTYSNSAPGGDRDSSYSNETSGTGRDSSYSNSASAQRDSAFSDSAESDIAKRLWEMSCKARDTLDATRRNSLMVSDTSSIPRTSENRAFQDLDKSIAEQADLLNVIGYVSTGRVYMDSESSGVRVSESSISEDERFEFLEDQDV